MQISIVMSVYNSEKCIAEAIDSVLFQSFVDFEFIIVDYGSTDNTIQIVKLYNDDRIVLIEGEHNFINSLNKGIEASQGKYIACMDADNIMHVDRLKIQFNTMEEEPNITICGTQVIFFGETININKMTNRPLGLIESPLIDLLKWNFISHSTIFIRKCFLQIHQLQYEIYPFAEDYKLWAEIAKMDGIFYIESQPLVYCRVSESQISSQKHKKQLETTCCVKEEIIDYLIEQCTIGQYEITGLRNNYMKLYDLGLTELEDIAQAFYWFFKKRKSSIRG